MHRFDAQYAILNEFHKLKIILLKTDKLKNYLKKKKKNSLNPP